METNLVILQRDLEEVLEGTYAVLRGDDSLCIRDEVLGPLVYITIEHDTEYDEDTTTLVFAEIAPPHIAAALAVMIDSILPVFVDCETLFTATKVERNVL
jgi:hypothetical protein